MDDETLLARVAAGRVAVHRALAAAAPGTRLERVAGVETLVTPAVPERSLPNAAALTGPHPDVDALARGLAALYRGAGVHAWTVWVPPAAAGAHRAGWPSTATCSTASRWGWARCWPTCRRPATTRSSSTRTRGSPTSRP